MTSTRLFVPMLIAIALSTTFEQVRAEITAEQAANAASKFCQAPTDYGFHREANGGLSGQLRAPAITRLLVEAGVGAKIAGSVEDWSGPTQSSFASDVTSYRTCLIAMSQFLRESTARLKPAQQKPGAQQKIPLSSAAETKSSAGCNVRVQLDNVDIGNSLGGIKSTLPCIDLSIQKSHFHDLTAPAVDLAPSGAIPPPH